MLTLYTWNTSNGKKPVILLEELGASYELVPVNLSRGEQKAEPYLRVNPNGKIPALVDGERDPPVRVFESGAVLLYLAERFGRFLPSSPAERIEALAWAFWQVGGLGPMLGQLIYFQNLDEPVPHALERFGQETLRLFEVLENRLEEHEHLATDEYSIADIMVWPWASIGLGRLDDAQRQQLPRVRAWVERIGARPAVLAALEKLALIA